jgi:hypothetical protein
MQARARRARFDVVIAIFFLHHLPDDELAALRINYGSKCRRAESSIRSTRAGTGCPAWWDGC